MLAQTFKSSNKHTRMHTDTPQTHTHAQLSVSSKEASSHSGKNYCWHKTNHRGTHHVIGRGGGASQSFITLSNIILRWDGNPAYPNCIISILGWFTLEVKSSNISPNSSQMLINLFYWGNKVAKLVQYVLCWFYLLCGNKSDILSIPFKTLHIALSLN